MKTILCALAISVALVGCASSPKPAASEPVRMSVRMEGNEVAGYEMAHPPYQKPIVVELVKVPAGETAQQVAQAKAAGARREANLGDEAWRLSERSVLVRKGERLVTITLGDDMPASQLHALASKFVAMLSTQPAR
jgi:hypothetical protein